MNVRGDFLGSPHSTNTTGVVYKKGKRKVQGVSQSQAAALPTKGDCKGANPGT